MVYVLSFAIFLATVSLNEARVTTTTENPIVIVEYEKARDTTTEPPEILFAEDENHEFFPDPDERIPDVAGARMVGDMILTKEQWEALIGRKAVTSLSRRWSQGSNNLPLVPYRINSNNNFGQINDGCTEKITTPGTVSSPSFPNNFSEDARMCTKVIKAPSCTIPQLNFTKFSLLPRRKCDDGDRCCLFNSLEIRNDYPNTSTAYCGTDIAVGQIFKGTSSQMVLLFDRTSSGAQGFSAELTFEPILNCNRSGGSITTTSTITPMALRSPPKCKVSASNGVFYWSSPYFGVSDYPNNFRCSIVGRSSSGTRMVTFKIETFELEAPFGNNMCYDYVKLNHLYNRTKMWCGSKDQQILFRSPTFNFRKEFSTDFSLTYEGFNISIIPSTGPNVNCHRTFYVGLRTHFLLKTPNMFSFSNKRSTLYCEYRIIAPSQNRINVRYVYTNMRDSTCEREFLLLNGMKQRQYPAATSKLYCNNTSQRNVMTTSTNELIVAYQKDYAEDSVFSSGALVYFYVV